MVFQANPPQRRTLSLPGCNFISFGSKNTTASKAPISFSLSLSFFLPPPCGFLCCLCFCLGSFYIFILTTVFGSSPAVMCFMETNFYIVVLTGLSKWKSWIIAHKSASDRILIISPRPDISKKLLTLTLLFFLLLWADKISKKVRERQDLLGECTIRTAQTSSTLLTYCTLKLGVVNHKKYNFYTDISSCISSDPTWVCNRNHRWWISYRASHQTWAVFSVSSVRWLSKKNALPFISDTVSSWLI